MLPRTSSACFRASANAPVAPAPDPGLVDLDFTRLMRRCPVRAGAPVAVAVSGGGDSMALLLLAARWASDNGHPLTALTVDHGLRADSAAEAALVGRWLAGRGIAHVVLRWQGNKPASGLQEAARTARYDLMADWAARNGVADLLLAHQQDDQAETMIMRLMRGSGISGLAAMRSVSMRGGLRLHRPLLPVSRARLRTTLGVFGQEWIEDPSNEQLRFARPRVRRLVTALGEGPRLAALAEEFARLDALLDAAAARLGGALVSRAGAEVSVDRPGFRTAPEPVAGRLLRTLIGEIGGADFAPRSDRLSRAFARIRSEEARPAFTLGRCRFKTRGNVLVVAREGHRRGFPKPAD
jgi:tRNA(Ile)-lysidine synthase